MSARKSPYTCSNPLCREPIQPVQTYSLELAQTMPARTLTERDGSVYVGRDGSPYVYSPRDRWHFCDLDCLRQFLALGALREQAKAERAEVAS